MASELELKAVVEDPARVREALVAAGARPVFRGLLRDTRLDAAGALTGRDQVLRLRRWIPDGGPERAELAWKGPTSVNPAGYKHREELEVGVADGSAALRLLAALGYTVTHAIDRAVEVYQLGATVARLEWYPRMDVLVEIEGPPEGIERMIQDDRYCADIIVQITAARASLQAVAKSLLAGHLRACNQAAKDNGGAAADRMYQELVDLVARMSK